ncbi:pyridoxal phosphate-dependent decarboxylase family protein [Legionella tunisiensis]|uniref:pyridoxal phosphate-dependent decarboxylase family protein n=1 Tax=Legionella tunisiensis TaxID=1034944 RepID=UPI000301781F|nr:aminotransferase class V-fold PLP-dependent enzyme [Legionella tunisiensis]
MSSAVSSVDEALADTPASQIILATAAAYFLYNQWNNPTIARSIRARHSKSYKQRVIDVAYDNAIKLPLVKGYIRQIVDEELDKNLQSTREKLTQARAEMSLRDEMPQEGLSPEEILGEFGISLDDCLYPFAVIDEHHDDIQAVVKAGDGKDSGALYAVPPKELNELRKEIYGKTELTNPMHAKWPRINAMQAEIIRWCQRLFHGSDNGYGLLTHGGTSSIIEAMAAYVMDARARGIEHPEIVVPETRHAAFDKAAKLTGATLVVVPVNPKTGAVEPKTMAKYLSGNTAVMVGSAPSFMNGIEEPIKELGALAKRKGIPLHVDACLGGFLTAFLDTSDNPMDFRVPGVTSISADLHKYGLCPKGTSVCLFSEDSPALSVYAALNWPGGLYATAGTLDGSTSGARVAEVYATLAYYGCQGYQEIAEAIIALRQEICYKLEELEDIELFGTPKWSVVGLKSATLSAHKIADELDKRGWKLNFLQNPYGFHLCLTQVHTLVPNLADGFIKDLKAAIATVKTYPSDHKPGGNVKVYGAVGTMPTAVQQEVCDQYQLARLGFNFLPNRSHRLRRKSQWIVYYKAD